MSSVERQLTPNQRLAHALSEAGLTREELAEKIQVDPKTVERWIVNGRTPYPAHQHRISEAVGVEEQALWPGGFKRSSRPRPAGENSRLREALFKARITPEQLAEKLEINPHTVQRWISRGTLPHPRFKSATAIEVGIPESELWPQKGDVVRGGAPSQSSTPPVGWVDDGKKPPEGSEWCYETTWDGRTIRGERLGMRPAAQSSTEAPRQSEPDREPKSLATVHELPGIEREPETNAVGEARMRELMSWIPPQRSALADYQPGSALAAALAKDRDGIER
ncbi:hypothetical protein KO481_22885 [Nocardia sp. NEAU-G5]|uniref:HTH cro/C1-type domain-containing protein n=1 Tax=Nocardia albiluteola TaxID=2842303 RepID=A0ABS6B3P3_9NOCA|nr:helix-turn-helix domain-containing protein [Nocardia albiluteola]MBU3064366.1 hypothetical protein [Nocardia albiluteola]